MHSSSDRHNTFLDGREEPSSSKRLLPLFWSGMGIICVFLSLFLVHRWFFPSWSFNFFSVLIQVGSVLGQLVGAYFCFSCLPPNWWKGGCSASPLQRAARWLPFWIGLAFVCNALADTVTCFYDLFYYNQVVDWPQLIYLFHYPCLLLAALALPGRRVSPLVRVRVSLDGLLVITALLTFYWYFLLGPLINSNHLSLFAKVVEAGFPIWDVVLCTCLLKLSGRSREPELRLTRWLLLLGFINLIVANSIHDYYVLQIPQILEPPSAFFQCVGYLLVALAVQSLRPLRALIANIPGNSPSETPALPSLRRALFPYVFVPAMIALMLVLWKTQKSGLLAQGVYFGGLLLIIQIVLRQVFIIREMHLSNQALHTVQQELHANNQELVTVKKRLEEQADQLAAAYEQQRQVNELKDQFLLAVNHELRTPLTEVYGYLELLHTYQDRLPAEEQATFLSHALHGSDELLNLVNTVLDALGSLGTEQKLRWETLSVLSVVYGAIDVFDLQKRQSHQIVVSISETISVKADRQYMHQILCNLLSNALHHSPPQSIVVIGADQEPSSSQVRIWIQDAGPTIAANEIPLLFEKFVRLKRDQMSALQGTGLGLYIGKQLVEAMGGQMWVERPLADAQGNRLCFTLPAPVENEDSPVLSSAAKSSS